MTYCTATLTLYYRLIVVTEAVIYLYELQTNRLLTTIDTPPNPHGTANDKLLSE